MFGDLVHSDRGGGDGKYIECGVFQIPWKTAGPSRQILATSAAHHHGIKAGVGEDWENTSEGGGGADSISKIFSAR